MNDLLDINDLTIKAENGITLVDAFTRSVAPGEIVGIVGESGSGKSRWPDRSSIFCPWACAGHPASSRSKDSPSTH